MTLETQRILLCIRVIVQIPLKISITVYICYVAVVTKKIKLVEINNLWYPLFPPKHETIYRFLEYTFSHLTEFSTSTTKSNYPMYLFFA